MTGWGGLMGEGPGAAPLPLPSVWAIRAIHGIIDPERSHEDDPW